MVEFFSTYREAISSAAVALALLAFVNGLWQYRRAQKWRKMEFVASEVKCFLANESVRDVLAMLDYRMKRFRPKNVNDKTIVVLHQSAKYYVCGEGEVSVLLAAALAFNYGNAVNEESRVVREKFDEYFDFIEKFAIFIKAGLFSFSDIEPYLNYHFDLLNANIRHSQGYHKELFEYLVIYKFDRVVFLIEKCAKSSPILNYIEDAKRLKLEFEASKGL